MVECLLSPAVPAAKARLWITVTAARTAEDIDTALAVLEMAGRAVGLI